MVLLIKKIFKLKPSQKQVKVINLIQTKEF